MVECDISADQIFINEFNAELDAEYPPQNCLFIFFKSGVKKIALPFWLFKSKHSKHLINFQTAKTFILKLLIHSFSSKWVIGVKL